MRIDIITVLPELIQGFMQESKSAEHKERDW